MNLAYDIEPADAVYLLALLDSPEGLPARPATELVPLLRNVLLLAHSVADNCREWLELCAIIDGDMPYYQAEKLNVPTLKGALSAAYAIPRVDACEGMCATCAFRVGSPANQTEATASDIMGCILDGTVFHCHDVEDPEEAKKPCRGFVAALKARRQAAQPEEVTP